MATEEKRIQRIIDNVGNIQNGQICIEPGADADIGGERLAWVDSHGTAHKALAKDEAARVTSLNATTSLMKAGSEVFVNGDDYIDLDTSASEPSYVPGRIFWDTTNDCPAYFDSHSGTIVQIAKEMLVDCCNNTGAQLNNGQVVCASDSTGTCLEVSLANAATYDRNQVIAVLTMDIANGTQGKATSYGRVNDFDTSHLTEGARVFLDTTDGLLTSTRPVFPAKPIIVGYCIRSHATEGVLFVNITPDRYDYEFDGCVVEKQDYTIVVDGANVYIDVEKDGGGDLPVQLSGDVHLLDCTSGSGAGGTARASLTVGTDTAIQYNYVYTNLVAGVTTLQSSTTAPTGVHAHIAHIGLWSASKTNTYGPAVDEIYIDAIHHDDSGHMAQINDRIRSMGAKWNNGVAPTVTITPNGAGLDSLNVSVTSGKVWRLHLHDFPSMSVSSDGAFTSNLSPKYTHITDLNSALYTSDGTPIAANRRFNLVVMGVVNKETGDCKLFVECPYGTYSTDEAAYLDTSRYSSLTIDEELSEGAFPIVRIPLLYTTVAGGTLSFINPVGKPQFIDLRGIPINSSASGAGGSVGASILNDLDDVSISTPVAGNVLEYNATAADWENSTTLARLDETRLGPNDVIAFTSETSAPASILSANSWPVSDLSGLTSTFTITGYSLQTVTYPASTTTAAQVISAINSQASGVTAESDGSGNVRVYTDAEDYEQKIIAGGTASTVFWIWEAYGEGIPAGTPTEGDRYIFRVDGATHEGQFAEYRNGGWVYYTPGNANRVYSLFDRFTYVWQDNDWKATIDWVLKATTNDGAGTGDTAIMSFDGATDYPQMDYQTASALGLPSEYGVGWLFDIELSVSQIVNSPGGSGISTGAWSFKGLAVPWRDATPASSAINGTANTGFPVDLTAVFAGYSVYDTPSIEIDTTTKELKINVGHTSSTSGDYNWVATIKGVVVGKMPGYVIPPA